MSVSALNLAILIMSSLCQPPSYWTKSLPDGDDRTETLRELYNKLKQDPDLFLDRHNMQLKGEDLLPPRKNSSEALKSLLYEHGYLKVEKNGQLDMLAFVNNSDFALYLDLVYITQIEDEVCRNALYKIKSTFERVPPEVDSFKSFILALDTVLSRIPHVSDDWELRAIVGAFHLCGLNVQVGGSPADHRIIHYEDLSNNTRLRIVVAGLHFGVNATGAWESYYKNLLLPGLLGQPSKNLLAVIVTLFYQHEKSESAIRDWYGSFESADGEVLREYRP